MARKSLINLSEIPIGETVPDGDELVGYRSSILYRDEQIEYYVAIPLRGNGRTADVRIVGYMQIVSRDKEENGHLPIKNPDKSLVEKLIAPKVRKLKECQGKKLRFTYLE